MEALGSLNRCHCSEPGFCPVFMRRMGTTPPDWQWCQRACKEDRESYYKLLMEEAKTQNRQLYEFFLDLDKKDIDKSLYLLSYLTMSDNYSKCRKALASQPERNDKLFEYIKNQKRLNYTLDDVEILTLGHSQQQFDTIVDQKYLKKINLNTIDAGKYSGNQWAESRGFISKNDLFRPSAKFVGFVTASWNLKYKPYTKIDCFHNWSSAKILLNSQPEDRVILCADMFCPCAWFPSERQGSSILRLFYGMQDELVSDKFKELFDLEITEHRKVPYSNQMICHRKIYEEYRDYLVNTKAFEKIEWLVDDFAKPYVRKYKDVNETYLNGRIYAYLMEIVTCAWFYNNDGFFIPNAERTESWYEQPSIEKRVKW